MRTGGRCWGRGQSGEPRGSPAVPAGRGAAPEGRGGPRAPRRPAAGSGRSEQVAGSGDAHSRGRLSRGPLQRESAKASGECERECVCECAHRPGRAGTRERAVAHVHAPWACGGSALLRRLVWSAGRSRSAAGPGGDARPCQRRTPPPVLRRGALGTCPTPNAASSPGPGLSPCSCAPGTPPERDPCLARLCDGGPRCPLLEPPVETPRKKAPGGPARGPPRDSSWALISHSRGFAFLGGGAPQRRCPLGTQACCSEASRGSTPIH